MYPQTFWLFFIFLSILVKSVFVWLALISYLSTSTEHSEKNQLSFIFLSILVGSIFFWIALLAPKFTPAEDVHTQQLLTPLSTPTSQINLFDEHKPNLKTFHAHFITQRYYMMVSLTKQMVDGNSNTYVVNSVLCIFNS